MFARVVAQSVPSLSGDIVDTNYRVTSENLSGLFANVCYSEGYGFGDITSKLQQSETNINRFYRVADTGHHSIADHANISVYLGGIGKITAMVLNSLEYYATSERSGRYTDMSKTAPFKENYYYNKWMDIISNKIAEIYPDIDDTRRRRLAQENARYFTDVTGPYTSMVYTTTYRQWSYIAQWFDDLLNSTDKTSSPFMFGIHRDFSYIRDFIVREKIGTSRLKNIKNRKLDFLSIQTNSDFPKEQQIGRMYTVLYDCSFSGLAQAQRHRTLKYMMQFHDTAPENFKFYEPAIIKDMSQEWHSDMRDACSACIVPQGILVHVAEMGDISNFALKCTERLCGRAQLEVAMLTKNTLDLLHQNIPKSSSSYDILDRLYLSDGSRCKSKCEILKTCKESCEFTAVNAVNRVI